MENLIEIKNVKKYFPIRRGVFRKEVGNVKAVDDISFHINKGETLGIVGESGCGKSTLGRCIVRLYNVTDGSVCFENQDIAKLGSKEFRMHKKDMQIIFQDPYGSLNPKFNIYEIISEPLVAYKAYSKDDRLVKVKELLKDVGLSEDYIYRYPHEFSGGQRQRISIARSLALNPKFIVCDEAVSALDVSTQSQILNLLKDLQKRYNLTYLFISHNLSVVNFISDRVGVMYLGRMVELAPVDRLYLNFKHPYTQALISAIPQPNPDNSNKRIILTGDVPSAVSPPSGCTFHPRCKNCQEICKNQRPEFKMVEKDHWVACHFPV